VMGGGDSSILNEEVRDRLQLVTEITAGDTTPPFVAQNTNAARMTPPNM